VGNEVVLECVVSVDTSLLQESEVFWTRDTRGTDSLRTALAIIRYCRTWAAAYFRSLRFSGQGIPWALTASGQL
jgi:hypothetical protein